MIRIISMAVSCFLMSACAGVQKVETIACQIDSPLVADVTALSPILVALDPAAAAIVAGLSAADAVVHPAVVAACAATGGHPVIPTGGIAGAAK